MKKTTIIAIFSLQVLTLAGVAATAYYTFMNKARIRATQRVMVDTQQRLSSTFTFMDKVEASQKEQEEATRPLPAGSKAPTFTLKDENAQEVKLEDYKGKKTLLVFSQESCPYCTKFYPVLNAFLEKKPNVNVVIMQTGSTTEQNQQLKKQQGINAPLLAASSVDLKNYKVQTTPTSVLIDEQGRVLGTRNVSQLDELIGFVEESATPLDTTTPENG